MTVNTSDITSGPYTGNGAASQFSYDFRIEHKNQIKVFETTDADIETTLVVDVDYTVNNIGTDGGGTIDRIAGALPLNYIWYIRSDYLATQETDLDSQGGFFSDIHEAAFDKLTFLVQQLYDLNDRTFRLSDSDTSDADLSLPNVAERAGKLISFDQVGDVDVVQEIGEWRGNWITAFLYKERDLFRDASTGNVYITVLEHTSTNLTDDYNSGAIDIIMFADQNNFLPPISPGDVTKILEVNVAEDGYNLIDNLLPVPSSGDLDKILKVNAAEDGYDLIDNNPVSVSSILIMPTSSVPSGFLECNGAAISRTVYSDLFASLGVLYGIGNGSTTFNIPDLRGEFLRGWDNGRAVDAGRAIGTYQEDTIQNITGAIGTDRGQISSGSGAFSGPTQTAGALINGSNLTIGRSFDFDASRVVRTSTETKPRNRAMMYVIRY